MSNDVVMFCCGCNRTKNDEDNWSYTYPDNFINARIVYGLCPGCMEEMYPSYRREAERFFLKKEHRQPAFA
ncbi:MAG: hypothetical protein K8R90_12065 [Candidatus Cloacimonetes bacterium]|nr:hypothetical protein [Candidatus Cloacimonadota bacterium]